MHVILCDLGFEPIFCFRKHPVDNPKSILQIFLTADYQAPLVD